MLEELKSQHLHFLTVSVAQRLLCFTWSPKTLSSMFGFFFPFSIFQLSETKIFTASNVSSVPLPAENVTITAGQR